jgi:hypothetical protein
MMSPAHILVAELRYQDLLKDAARARLIKAAMSTEPIVTKPSPVSRVRAAARQVLAAFAGVSFTPGTNRPAAA